MTEITDADRKAAAAFKDSVFVHPDILARAFAAHRLQERDRVVAWLMERASIKFPGETSHVIDQASAVFAAIAGSIASGAHDHD